MANRITIKSKDELNTMRRAGALLREVMEEVIGHVRPGVTTGELDRVARHEIERRGAIPAFLGLYDFPGSLCISINEEIVHGIPGKRVLVEGDIASLDLGLILDGYYADMARTVPVGRADEVSNRLIQVTGEALEIGIEFLRPGLRMGDLSAAVQAHVERNGFAVVRDYTGHGIGRRPHEDPKIPNYGEPGRGVRWQVGMVVCIEPMVNVGTYQTLLREDRWTVVTADGSRSAHMEDTIAVTEDGPWVLTAP
ncbi:MAG TPA: type I methionyl aminopeptidase [Candidatus Sumerlaeota bacterium]|nr:MAG: Methionine aminopeptidase 1 [candidate division BRC1 bacterium ADurb.BinA292]HOE96673.1 type I methionyl aminopeptidase [Candidatus Sumerlaeota bacterium]HOR27542.1 type I methionyl aminopeptidase [Candidatus Sumerlaeota bacterium]HPK02557.1 type I methionyl aminopeptidase [Candidatus Sumerlaeota bacterium]